VGTQGQQAFEQPDFEGVVLSGDRELLKGRVPGQRVRVTGFYGRAWDPSTPIYPGYKGPTLHVDTIRREPNGAPRPGRREFAPPPPWSRRGPVFSVLKPSGEGPNHLDFDTLLPDSTRLYALITGLGARGTEWFAARLAQAALATLFEEARYEPVLAHNLEPPQLPLQDPEAWAAWLIERGPLPRGLAGLLRATGRRLGRVFDEAKVRGWEVGAGGILAAVRARQEGPVAAFRVYGGARLYLERRGRLQVLGFEHTFRRLPNLSPEERAALGHGGLWTDHFGEFQLRQAPPEDGPFEVDLRPGDRLVLVCGDALLDALEPIERAPSILEALRDGMAALHELPVERAGDMIEQGLGLMTIDV
jgi:hypothetical protein